jgi:fatty-acyl-CoA synthase
LLDEQVRNYGHRPALVGSGRRWSYSDLNDEVMKIARRLFRLGVGKGDKVGILMGNEPEWISSALAITSLGAAMVSINTWVTPRELEYLVRHSDCKYVIATPHFLKAEYGGMFKSLEPLDERLPLLRGILGVGAKLPDDWLPLHEAEASADLSADTAIRDAFAVVAPDDLAFLIYTSGSTSTPKGVEIAHRGLIENAWQIGERLHVSEDDRIWLAVSLFWGMGCENAMMNALTHGACMVLQAHFEPGEALRLIEEEKCTIYYGAPPLASAMFAHPDRTRYDLSLMKRGISGGTPQQLQQIVALGVTHICQVYGLTETYANSHVNDSNDSPERRLESCGRPLPGFVQRIVGRDGRELPPGEEGELRLKGHITSGYYKESKLTACSFDEDGYFKTGDLCCIDAQGYLYFRGRLKELVKTRGLNVAPMEVEAVLALHPAVHLAQVVGVPDSSQDEVLAAAVIVKPGAKVTADELTKFCRSKLSAYKVPRLIRFVGEHDLPLTSTGKIQKNRIAATFFSATKICLPSGC